jgi:hypothetical protein
VEYWRAPDKAGWMQCQGETMKLWRRRWFVLKQGYLFRFMGPDVTGGRVGLRVLRREGPTNRHSRSQGERDKMYPGI